MATQFNKYGFVDGEQVYVKNSEGIYNADIVELDSVGVYLERTGVDRVFIPWCDVVRIYQIVNVSAANLASPNSVQVEKFSQ